MRGSGRFSEAQLIAELDATASQSPSLRGSGRFALIGSIVNWVLIKSQSPSLRGSGRFKKEVEARREAEASLNPLHCGAVVASRARRSRGNRRRRAFQSPSLRGSGRFELIGLADSLVKAKFQSPSLRGSGRFDTGSTQQVGMQSSFNPLHCGAVVASPPQDLIGIPERLGFNPLHCGAVVASLSSC